MTLPIGDCGAAAAGAGNLGLLGGDVGRLAGRPGRPAAEHRQEKGTESDRFRAHATSLLPGRRP